MDEILDAEITIKAIGNQWYWNYEYSDYFHLNNKEIEFELYNYYKYLKDIYI